MDRPSIDDLEAIGTLPDGLSLEGADVTGCRFEGIDLTEASLRGARLTDCRFERCEMTLVDLTDATLHDVEMVACRLQGVAFEATARDPFGLSVTYRDCDLGLASFRDLDMRACRFEGGRMREAFLVDCDLRAVPLRDLDATGAEIRRCDLRAADMRGSTGLVFSPCDNRVRGLRIDAEAALGVLAAVGIACA